MVSKPVRNRGDVSWAQRRGKKAKAIDTAEFISKPCSKPVHFPGNCFHRDCKCDCHKSLSTTARRK